MYLITNRDIIKGARGLKKFGKKPNTEGPNELRLRADHTFDRLP